VVQQDLSTALDLRDYLVRAVSPALASDGHLMTGMVRMNSFLAQANDSELDPASLQLHNSMAAIDRHGVLVDSYDKVKLVPLGEYVPYRHYLKHLDLSRLTPGPYDFLPGQNDHLIRLSDGSKWVPLICYEVIFPNLRLRPYFGGDQPPRAMTAITNDAWFGNSKGPYQHLAMARVRAVEYGLPLLRAANTGISAISDPMGRTLARLPLGQLGHLDGDLPLTVPSFYAQQGERPIGAILLLLLLLIARVCRPKTAT
jgi:apolipoprotein N-acyltransferase